MHIRTLRIDVLTQDIQWTHWFPWSTRTTFQAMDKIFIYKYIIIWFLWRSFVYHILDQFMALLSSFLFKIQNRHEVYELRILPHNGSKVMRWQFEIQTNSHPQNNIKSLSINIRLHNYLVAVYISTKDVISFKLLARNSNYQQRYYHVHKWSFIHIDMRNNKSRYFCYI